MSQMNTVQASERCNASFQGENPKAKPQSLEAPERKTEGDKERMKKEEKERGEGKSHHVFISL